ncbi:DNA-binding protein [Stigmatella sp. ncwal1]|uniref:DNA-binding protein n=1 Tax=Stigmatella ashevillensis TaxID=2995309 RepID=A0ABT5DH45_9BACT|nr:DNA-binding protein [Stigmatella ashevillena]MDC0712083.1 DNA-binding protein [Stigmatella ashevillena]
MTSSPSFSRSPRFSSPSRLPVLLLGVTLAAWLAGCGDDEDGQLPKPVSIAEARGRSIGSTVTTQGFVTVQPGAFQSAIGDNGFAIQDRTSGIYVKLEQKLNFGLGTQVRVQGTVDEQNGLRILKSQPSLVEQIPGTRITEPRSVRTGEVNESTEGLLVQVTGNVTQVFRDDSPNGYELFINDGSGEIQIYVHLTAGFDAATLQALQLGQSITVVGLTAQYETNYEVAPRQPSDLKTH